ncbi:MAG: hypothetical protein JSS59_12395 [Proteobacteria bacterium]|uniref:hypothetical protein n=1 Tax=Rudaea sp. TaxID=2136325 RepID=UPI0037846EAA|nr:hypothetical protein [Pseudomonadota bacterium]
MRGAPVVEIDAFLFLALRQCGKAAWLVGASLIAAATADAQSLNYTLQVGVEHSDNIAETATQRVDDNVLIPRLTFDWVEQGSTLQAQANGTIEYRDYLGGRFDNELRGQLSGIANWVILPQRLSFDFEDYAGVQPVNVFQSSNAPGQQQQTNVFSLGPTLMFRVGSGMRGEADLRFTDSTASVVKEFDSQRTSIGVRAIRDLSQTDQLSANVDAQHIHFTDSSGGPDYDRYSAYARYLSKLSQIDLDFSLGYTGLDFSHAPGRSGPLLRGNLKWRATPSSAFELGFVRRYSDATEDLMIDPSALIARTTGGPIVTGSVPITSQAFLEKRFDASYTYQAPRLNVRLAPFFGDLQYSLVPSANEAALGATDQTTHGMIATANYLLRPLWSLGFSAAEETRKYTQIDRHDEDLRYGLSLTNQLSRQWSWRVDLIRNQRSSTEVLQKFSENIAMLTIIFRR